ncbi:MAG: hypothetical protein HRU20_02140 [Pseudomonadales bacterium]|nr:hypothetical protein [Pseudomonadales bacterium]
MNYRGLFSAVLLVLFNPAQASELASSYELLCDKIKSCASVEMADLPPESRVMMEPMLNSMCLAMQKNFQQATIYADLEHGAAACVRSMADLPCDKFKNAETKECQAFKKKAQSYEKAHY